MRSAGQIVDALERRVLLSFTATLSGNTATFTGNSSGITGDIAIFSQAGGLLNHNRGLVDPGFNSAFDFNSAVAGDQTLSASAASTVNIITGSGPDAISIGGQISSGNSVIAASTLLAAFSVVSNAGTGKTLTVDDSASPTGNTFGVIPGSVTATGINVTYSGPAPFTGGISVMGSAAADVFNVKSSTTEPYSLFGNNPTTPPGDVLNFDGQGIPASDNGTQITQAGRATVAYSQFETVNISNAPLALSIDDVTLAEGTGSGTKSFDFTVSLSASSSNPVTVDFSTAGGTATVADADYIANSGTLSFAPGQTSKTVSVLVNQDTTNEPNEQFTVVLSNPNSAAVIADGTGTGTISNDDSVPAVSVDDVTVTEGNAGTTAATFTVSLNHPSSQQIVITYTTSDGSATTADADYVDNDGSVTFAPGETSKPVTVLINGDTNPEPSETFAITLVSGTPPGSVVGGDSSGLGTITDDDATLASLVVTNTNDSGPGSLRNAIVVANILTGPNTITFDIPGAGPHVIATATALPAIAQPVTIDGKSEPDFAAAGKPVVVLDGALAGAGVDGLSITATADGSMIRGLQIVRFKSAGIHILSGASEVVITCNYLGTDGTASLGNATAGLILEGDKARVGGTDPTDRNIMSGNGRGIFMTGAGATGNTILGNYIGTNALGTAPIKNQSDGFEISDAPGNTIGGAAAGARNVISGNNFSGILIGGAGSVGNAILGNFIGTDAVGMAAIPNGEDGVHTAGGGTRVGGSGVGEGNLISGNTLDGVIVSARSGTIVAGNLIGTDVTGIAPLGNHGDGVSISDATQNVIGGLLPGAGNVIAFNHRNGVTVTTATATSNSILSNSIFSNVLLGIDLNSDGVTPNDAGDTDTGPNKLMNYPELQMAFTNATGVAVLGRLNTIANRDVTVQFFAEPAGDPQGFGEGRRLLGTTVISSGPLGTSAFGAEFPIAIPAGQAITATATLSDQGTSEFSNFQTVTGTGPSFAITDVAVAEGTGGPTFATFTVTLSDAISVPASVNFATADGSAVAQGDYLSQTGTLLFAAGQTSKTIVVAINTDAAAEGPETFAVNLSSPTFANIVDGQGVGTILDGTGVTPTPTPNPTPTPPPPYFTISDVTETEGNSGTKQFVFTVTRNGGTSGPASVQFQTQNQTAGSGDYDAKSGTLNFANGEATRMIPITVKGDTKSEGDESFRVILSNAVGATIAGSNGIVKILNHDGGSPPQPPQPPALKSLSIGDAQITEGQNGTKILNFTVTLSGAASGNVVVKYRTQNQTAGSGDYDSKTGALTFTPGQTSKTISITIKGDTKVEGNETFRVELFENLNATILDGTGIGTIKNDD